MVNDHAQKLATLEGNKLVEHLNSLTARLTARYDAVKDLNAKVVAKLPHDKQAADYDKQYDYELKVFDALETVKTRQQQLRDDAAAVSSPQPASIPSSQPQNLSKFLNLPKVNVPIIPKDTTKFLSWYDQFNSTIHDVSFLTNVVKLQYLRQSCQQNFPTIIDHIPTAGGDNYDRARQVIFERLHNPRVIAYSLINNFISAPQIKSDNGSSILRMVEQIRGMIADLHKLNVNTQNWDCIIMCILTDKMDEVTRREYLTRHPSKDIPYLAHCITFLEERGIALSVLHKNKETSDETKKKPNNQNNQSLANKQLAATAQLVAAAQNLTSANATPPSGMKKKDAEKKPWKTPVCVCCAESHWVTKCASFLKLTPQERYNKVKEKNNCFNCLGSGHPRTKCPVLGRCRTCSKPHHSLLHFDTAETKDNAEKPAEKNRGHGGAAYHAKEGIQVSVLGTAAIPCVDKNGDLQVGRALIDSGSMMNMITEEFATLLKYDVVPAKFTINTVGNNAPQESKGTIDFHLKTTDGESFLVHAQILKECTGPIPVARIDLSKLPEIAGKNFGRSSFPYSQTSRHDPGDRTLQLPHDVRSYQVRKNCHGRD